MKVMRARAQPRSQVVIAGKSSKHDARDYDCGSGVYAPLRFARSLFMGCVGRRWPSREGIHCRFIALEARVACPARIAQIKRPEGIVLFDEQADGARLVACAERISQDVFRILSPVDGNEACCRVSFRLDRPESPVSGK